LVASAAIVMLRAMDEAGDWLKPAFGRLLKELREKRGLSQSQLALESELDQTFVSLLERGQRQPSLVSLFALCDALDVAPDVVIKGLMAARPPSRHRN
jgi:transcriptional regulator with XRE-family HTH domain